MVLYAEIIDPIAILPFYYELSIFIIGMVLFAFIIARYREKKNELTKILMISILCYNLAIMFAMFGKILTLYYAGDFSSETVIIQEIFGRIHALRFTFSLVGIAALFSYKFKSIVFEKRANPTVQKLVYIFGVATILVSIFVFSPANKSLNLPAFFLIFILMIIIYFPFMFQSFTTGMRMVEKHYKQAFFSLGLMSLFYIMLFLFFIIDNVMLLLYQIRFSAFYYIAWAFALMAIITGYLGYIRPGSVKENEKEK